jgi:exopolysaccharide biosynthesis polyprenyl glycosylphosphotransferase
MEQEALEAARGLIRPPSLRLRVSERKVLLLLMDVFFVNLGLVAALVVWADFPLSPRTLLLNSKWFATLAAEWLLCAMFFHSYDLARAASTWSSLRSSGPAALAAVAIYALTPWLTPSLGSRGLLATFAGLAVLSVMAWRAVYAELFVQPWFKQRALVVGAGWAGKTLVAALQHAPEGVPNPYRGTGFQIVGFVDDNVDYHGAYFDDVPVLGGSAALVALAQELQVDEVILAITHRQAIADELFDAVLRCRELGFRVTTMSVLYERLLGRVPVEHIGRDLHMVVRMHETAGERFYLGLKRLSDLFMAVWGLVLMGAMTPLVALGNAIGGPGPLLYRQRRVGRGGETFEMLKFRTMKPGAEDEVGAVWAGERDERVTPVGRLLRALRLDELPQCLNVLRGDMSIIGPRPERPEFVEQLAHTLPFYRARHAVRPGITGWAQIQFEYGNSVDDAKAKLEYDLYYVKNANPLLDLRIALQTIPVMVGMKGI